ncbi:MAG: hypothetical protein GQE15_32150 [Archangiaceae bacterium]|nr:hypothetical protein [Archangiaceae bacterium]
MEQLTSAQQTAVGLALPDDDFVRCVIERHLEKLGARRHIDAQHGSLDQLDEIRTGIDHELSRLAPTGDLYPGLRHLELLARLLAEVPFDGRGLSGTIDGAPPGLSARAAPLVFELESIVFVVGSDPAVVPAVGHREQSMAVRTTNECVVATVAEFLPSAVCALANALEVLGELRTEREAGAECEGEQHDRRTHAHRDPNFEGPVSTDSANSNPRGAHVQSIWVRSRPETLTSREVNNWLGARALHAPLSHAETSTPSGALSNDTSNPWEVLT